MNATDLLPWLNLLLLPIARAVMDIQRRVTRLEALREADDNARRAAAAQPIPLTNH